MFNLRLTAAVKPLLSSLDCPRSLAVWLLLESGELKQLVNLTVNPFHHLDFESFESAYIATNLLRKYEDFELDETPRSVAMRSFLEGELRCASTNERLRINRRRFTSGPVPGIIQEARRIIRDTIGDSVFSRVGSRKAFDNGFSWGPGSTSDAKRAFVSLADKLECPMGITASLNHVVPLTKVIAQIPRWLQCWVEGSSASYRILPGNRVAFVKKNAKTDRCIAIEPHVNVLFQKGLGSVIRKCLLRSGVDLDSDQKNQKMAYTGSVDNSIATIDLAAASDTISIEAVRELLPPSWFRALDCARSQNYIADDFNDEGEAIEVVKRYEKFSSMGNGFTFELESLIFWAIATACEEAVGLCGDVGIFGDDICISSKAVPLLKEALDFMGFTINDEKSFDVGPFRESCGGDFYLGQRVRSISLRRLGSARDVVLFHNLLTEASLLPFGRDKRFQSAILRCRDFVKKLQRDLPKGKTFELGPYGLDGCLWACFDEAKPNTCKKRSAFYCRIVYRVRREVWTNATINKSAHADMLSALWRLETPPKPNPFTTSISTSASDGRPLRGEGKWIFRVTSADVFPFIGPFI